MKLDGLVKKNKYKGDLKMKKELVPAEEYRKCKLVNTKLINDYYYWACPRCGTTALRDYQSFCSGCGQKLRWGYPKMKRVLDVEMGVLIDQNTNEIVFKGYIEHCEMMFDVHRCLSPNESYIIKKLNQRTIHYSKIKLK